MTSQPSDEAGRPPADQPCEDLAAILRDIASLDRMEQIRERLKDRDDDLAAALQLQQEVQFLAGILARGRPKTPGAWFRAKRILVRRFGRLSTVYLIRLLTPVSSEEFRLIIRERRDEELPDRGSARRRAAQEWEDFELAREVLRNRSKGMRNQEAIEAAVEALGRTSRGIEGAKKAMTRFRRRARERGYVDPFAAVTASLLGGCLDEPYYRIADLPAPGRPKKTTDGE